MKKNVIHCLSNISKFNSLNLCIKKICTHACTHEVLRPGFRWGSVNFKITKNILIRKHVLKQLLMIFELIFFTCGGSKTDFGLCSSFSEVASPSPSWSSWNETKTQFEIKFQTTFKIIFGMICYFLIQFQFDIGHYTQFT